MLYLAVFLFVLGLGTFLGYIFHRMFHQPWSGKFYDAHMTHHTKLYPASDYTSDEYREPGKDNTVWLFLLAFSPLGIIVLSLMLFSVIPIAMGIGIILEMILIGFVNNNMHDGFHLRKSFWDRFKFFSHLRKLHYEHHVDMSKNYGIFYFMWDKLFGTFKN
jgi:sterol desaturase/sphingolipid hydroxylase (fatty acid hydroxylase superfamily)